MLLACVAPCGSREDETLTTIRYSQLASRILNKPQVRGAPWAARVFFGSSPSAPTCTQRLCEPLWPQVDVALLLQRELERLKEDQAAEVARTRAANSMLTIKLERVRAMRDKLLRAHQVCCQWLGVLRTCGGVACVVPALPGLQD